MRGSNQKIKSESLPVLCELRQDKISFFKSSSFVGLLFPYDFYFIIQGCDICSMHNEPYFTKQRK